VVMIVVFWASSTSAEEFGWWDVWHCWVRKQYSAAGRSSPAADWTHIGGEYTQLLRWQDHTSWVLIKGMFQLIFSHARLHKVTFYLVL